MSKFLDSCRKKWHQFGRNKDCHKILHDISNKWTVNKTDQGTVYGHTGHLLDTYLPLLVKVVKERPIRHTLGRMDIGRKCLKALDSY